MTDADIAAAAPAIVLATGACAIAVLAASGKVRARALAWLGVLVGAGAAVTAIAIGSGTPGLGATLARDGVGTFFAVLVGLAAAAGLALAGSDPRLAHRLRRHEVALVLFSSCGAALLCVANDLVVLFVALALASVPLFVLDRSGPRYYLRGATSSAVALYGIALLYTATGETGYAGLGRATHNPLYLAGLALVLAGLTFHAVLGARRTWSVAASIAAFAALARLAAATRSGEAALDWQVSLATIAALCFALGALAALAEQRLGRLLQYATVSQAGYVLTALAASAAPAAAFAVTISTTIALGTFGVFGLIRAPEGDAPTLRDLAGLARQRPLIVVALGVLMSALVGLPPTAGFLAKLYVFEVATRAQLLWLVVLGALAAVVSTAACVRVLLACFAPPPLQAIAHPPARVGTAIVLLAAFAVVVVGIWPGALLELAQAVRF